jgi:hypothetical protein
MHAEPFARGKFGARILLAADPPRPRRARSGSRESAVRALPK